DWMAQRNDVLDVLGELGVADRAQDSIVEVWNKIDLLPAGKRPQGGNGKREPKQVAVSALTGEGFERLLKMIDETLAEGAIEAELRLEPDEGADLAWAYSNGEVLKRSSDAKGRVKLRVAIASPLLPRFERRFGARLVRTGA